MSKIREMPAPEGVRDYVEKGRALFGEHFPGQDFDAPVWDVSPLKQFGHKRSNKRVYWTTHGSQKEALPSRFVDPVKAACVLDIQSATNLVLRVSATRVLWEHLRKKKTGQTFRWADVTTDDMLGMEDLAREYWSTSTTYKTLMSWNRVLELLASAGIIRPMNVPWRTARPEDTERHTLAGREERRKKLPSDEAIEAVADIYSDHAETSKDQLLSCVLAILTTTGLRIGEVLNLPYDCLINMDEAGEEGRWMLRYWAEKSGRGWVPAEPLSLEPRPASLLREAVEKVRDLTKSARERARVLEENPGRAPLPGMENQEEISLSELASLFGWTSRRSSSGVKRKGIEVQSRPVEGKRHPFNYCRTEDVERYLVEKQKELSTLSLGNGEKQLFSESLFVVHERFFHSLWSEHPLLVDGMTVQQVNNFLGGRWTNCEGSHENAERRKGKWMRPQVKSAFDRFGFTEADGSRIEMTSHAFRHWVTTNLLAGGAPDAVVARWQNRSHQGDLGAYDHRTNQQRVEALRDALESGRVRGEKAQMYFSLAEDIRDVWLHDQVHHVHVTDYGLCTHDFSLEPCPHHINCLKGCKHYVHDSGDEKQREQLVQLKMRTEKCLEEEQALAEKLGDPISENWLTDYKLLIENIDKILDSASEEGTQLVMPFEDGESKYSPLQ